MAEQPRRRGSGGLFRLLGAGLVLGVFGWGAASATFQLQAGQPQTAECIALALDRDTGETRAVPCLGPGPEMKTTLTALLPGSLPEEVAAAR